MQRDWLWKRIWLIQSELSLYLAKVLFEILIDIGELQKVADAIPTPRKQRGSQDKSYLNENLLVHIKAKYRQNNSTDYTGSGLNQIHKVYSKDPRSANRSKFKLGAQKTPIIGNRKYRNLHTAVPNARNIVIASGEANACGDFYTTSQQRKKNRITIESTQQSKSPNLISKDLTNNNSAQIRVNSRKKSTPGLKKELHNNGYLFNPYYNHHKSKPQSVNWS